MTEMNFQNFFKISKIAEIKYSEKTYSSFTSQFDICTLK